MEEVTEEIFPLLASARTSRGKPDCTGSVMKHTDTNAMEYTRQRNGYVTVPTSRQQTELFRLRGAPNRTNKEKEKDDIEPCWGCRELYWKRE